MNHSQKLASQVQTATNSRKGILGIGIFSLFVFASVMVTQTVQALNLAAGNYGYYGGTYGYNASATSSDDVPRAPTSLSASNTATTSITLSWTAPTLTVSGTAISTGSGSVASYKIAYNTGTVSSCTSATATTSTSATVNLTGLDSNTTYNVKVCAVDNNQNVGSALSTTFITASGGGSGGGGGNAGSVFSSVPTKVVSTPSGNVIVTPGAIASSAVVADAAALTASLGITRNKGIETAAAAQVAALVRKTGVKLSALDTLKATNFIAYGVDSNTIKLGLGVRKDLVGEILAIYSSLNINTLTELAAGKKPTQRNLTFERKQVGLANQLLVRIMGHKIDFKDKTQDLAYNSVIYPVRFPGRDLKKEGSAAAKFKKLVGRTPTSPLDWSVVRVMANTGLKTR